MSEQERPVEPPAQARADTWRDFRRGIALLVIVLFSLSLIATGSAAFRYMFTDTDVRPDAIGAFGFLAVAVALGVAAYAGVGVLLATDTVRSKRSGRTMWRAFAAAIVVLVVTGVIGDMIR